MAPFFYLARQADCKTPVATSGVRPVLLGLWAALCLSPLSTVPAAGGVHGVRRAARPRLQAGGLAQSVVWPWGWVRTQRDAMNGIGSLMKLADRSPERAMDMLIDMLPPMDDNVTSSDLLAPLGYPTEGHYATTEDGCRLRLDRVANPGRPPVYLAHGMQTASPSFALLGRGRDLSALLHDAGYDVWMVNFRGTHHSQGHDKYSVRDEAYWRFSFHEHGVLDNPAAIDYVLAHTGFDSVMYIGHSMGCTSFMVMASTLPEYQAKVGGAFLLAPAGPLHHHRSPMVRLLYAVNNVTQSMADTLGLHRLMRPTYRLFRRLGRMLPKALKASLYDFTATIVGKNPQAAYYELPSFFDSIPSGGSWGEIFHYVQNSNPREKGFRQYDHGVKKNLEKYGTPKPPEYDLSKIETPMFLYLADNDVLCARQDTDYLISQFKNVMRVLYAESPEFNHMDFIGSQKAPDEVYHPLINDMKKFEKGRSHAASKTSPGQ